MKRVLLGAFALTAVFACSGDEPVCAEGYVPSATGCRFLPLDARVPVDGGDAGDASSALADTGARDSARDSGYDAGPCGSSCSGETPYCDTANNRCVECLPNQRCTDPEKPVCSDGACTICTLDAHCSGFAATPICDTASGRCVACTLDNDSACGNTSCDAAAQVCTETPRASVATCGPCLADSECMNANDRCVPMTFMGTPRPGGFCLRLASAGCARPYFPAPAQRTSLSGMSDTYCVLIEELATCEALGSWFEGVECTDAAQCGNSELDDGRCETIRGRSKCTYTCARVDDCPATSSCTSGFCD